MIFNLIITIVLSRLTVEKANEDWARLTATKEEIL